MIFKTFQNNFGSLSGIYPLPGICYVLFLPSIIGVSLSGERPHSLHFRQDCQHNGGYKYFLTRKYFRQIKILLPTLWKLWSPSLTESSGNAFNNQQSDIIIIIIIIMPSYHTWDTASHSSASPTSPASSSPPPPSSWCPPEWRCLRSCQNGSPATTTIASDLTITD